MSRTSPAARQDLANAREALAVERTTRIAMTDNETNNDPAVLPENRAQMNALRKIQTDREYDRKSQTLEASFQMESKANDAAAKAAADFSDKAYLTRGAMVYEVKSRCEEEALKTAMKQLTKLNADIEVLSKALTQVTANIPPDANGEGLLLPEPTINTLKSFAIVLPPEKRRESYWRVWYGQAQMQQIAENIKSFLSALNTAQSMLTTQIQQCTGKMQSAIDAKQAFAKDNQQTSMVAINNI